MNFQTQPRGMWMKIHTVRYAPFVGADNRFLYGSRPTFVSWAIPVFAFFTTLMPIMIYAALQVITLVTTALYPAVFSIPETFFSQIPRNQFYPCHINNHNNFSVFTIFY